MVSFHLACAQTKEVEDLVVAVADLVEAVVVVAPEVTLDHNKMYFIILH